jgi:hypothetical protein
MRDQFGLQRTSGQKEQEKRVPFMDTTQQHTGDPYSMSACKQNSSGLAVGPEKRTIQDREMIQVQEYSVVSSFVD